MDYWAWFYGTDEDATEAVFAHEHSVLTDLRGDFAGSRDTVWTLGNDGARAGIESTTAGESLVFVPGRLDVPNDFAEGSAWTSEGTAFQWDHASSGYLEFPYEASYRASRASQSGAGCLDVEMRFDLDGDSSASRRTWCRGEGIVRFSDSASVWVPTEARPTVNLWDAPFDWERSADLEYSVVVANQRGVEGSVPLSPGVDSPPGVVGGGAIFANRMRPDVLALDVTVDPASIVWGARPGGYPTASATLGSVTIVATAELTAVAYGLAGQWLWEVPLSDIAVVPPVRFGADLAVLATLDGELMAMDLESGSVVWSKRVDGPIRVAPTVSEDALVVAADDGSLRRFDRDGEEVWSTDIARPGSVTITESQSPVVVVGDGDGGNVHGYRLTDGAVLWSRNLGSIALQLITMDDVVALRGAYHVVGINPVDGAVLWDWSDQPTWFGVGGGRSLLVMSEKELILLDGSGVPVRSWAHQLGRVTGSTALMAAEGDTVIVYGPSGIGVGVVP